jgi:copper chaperone CopZ
MSRRRGEFEHRTSIFEGAFRAWSHLGGLEPEDVESRPASELDPLTNPIENDSRLTAKKALKQENAFDPNGSPRRQYPYEPLPRSGLAHPYVQAILSPWLGPDADNDAIQLGLTTLRTWWQHRRKGESGSAIAALGTEKMKGVIEGYTRHFFTLAHCLILNDKEQPPRTLQVKMRELEKMRSKRNKKRNRDDAIGGLPSVLDMDDDMDSGGDMGMTGDPLAASLTADLRNSELSPLERLHMAQQKQLAAQGIIDTLDDLSDVGQPIMPIINIKNKCVPGKPDLPAIVDAVNHVANQLAHSGNRGMPPSSVPSSVVSGSSYANFGDPNSIPIVFVSENGDAMIAMAVDGITCAHCVKIVETVLRGCNGNKSPIDGLLDAAADRALCAVLIRVDRVSNSKRIAFEAARNLAMVGYTAKAKTMNPVVEKDGNPVKMSLDEMYNAFQAVGHADPKDLFDWSSPCSCPDNGLARDDCAR